MVCARELLVSTEVQDVFYVNIPKTIIHSHFGAMETNHQSNRHTESEHAPPKDQQYPGAFRPTLLLR